VRPGGERRGNSRDRAARRRWLLATFDRDLGDELARCWLQISEFCLQEVDARTLTVDRINAGGTYARTNIQPACRPCQNKQGALITKERRDEWRRWVEEAAAAGIEWNGTAM
jgi:5-methylcytosine-specific restriction endonuclease McrA